MYIYPTFQIKLVIAVPNKFPILLLLIAKHTNFSVFDHQKHLIQSLTKWKWCSSMGHLGNQVTFALFELLKFHFHQIYLTDIVFVWKMKIVLLSFLMLGLRWRIQSVYRQSFVFVMINLSVPSHLTFINEMLVTLRVDTDGFFLPKPFNESVYKYQKGDRKSTKNLH